MKSNKKYLIIAVLFGLITVLLLSVYFHRLGDSAGKDLALEKVVAATATIPAYTVITAEMLEEISLPEMAVHAGAVRDAEEIVGGVTRVELIAGEQILAERVVVDLEQANFACRVPEGMRAVSIPVNAVSGVGGYISPGDRVDLLVSGDNGAGKVTFTAMQDVVVLAAGPDYREREENEPEVVETLTLAVTPAQAQEIAFYTLEHTFHVVLRYPGDRGTAALGAFGARGGALPQASKSNSLPKTRGDSDHGKD